MKKIMFFFALVLTMALCACDKSEKKADVVTDGNTTVESLIKQDNAYFANMAGKVMFYESQVVLSKPFNEGDHFAVLEVTNIFEQILTQGDSTVCNVYEFHHPVNYTETQIIIHKNSSPWIEDIVMNDGDVKLTFDEAYERAKESDLVPSKSRYMVLRNPLGPNRVSPQYIIGNDGMGTMFVDSKTGAVIDKNPAFNN